MSSHLDVSMGTSGAYSRSNGSSILSFDGSDSREIKDDYKKGHQSLVEWLNEMLPYLNLPWEASEDELRACLIDGTVLCSLLNQLSPGSVRMGGSFEPASVKIERFLTAMDEMALPRFEVSDLEQGDMVPVLQSLKALKASFSDGGHDKNSIYVRRRWSLPEDHSKGADNSFSDGFQFKEASDINISDAKILELLKSNNLQNASTRSLFDMLDKLLDESIEKINGSTSKAISPILKAIVQVIEQRISIQAENLKNQNILIRVREEKYRSRIKVLETLAAGTTEENEIVTNRLEHMKIEKGRGDERERSEEKDVMRLKKEKERSDAENTKLKRDLEIAKKTYEKRCLELEAKTQKLKVELEKKVKDAESCESRIQEWEKKENTYSHFIDRQSAALQELKASSESLKHQVVEAQKSYTIDLSYYGLRLKGVADAAKHYHVVLEENRRLYNEIQELKGNIRVYCRIRPFLEGQSKRQATIDYIGENGELVVTNPLKQGKETHRLFKFNKVFGPTATQEEVFLDTRPLIRSILDGYNVCIFAYGQTGSGKTYTMSGPSITSKEDWGVNYRALNDLFELTQSRQNTFAYEVGVQMVEIYNEQVRDLLSEGGSHRKLGIWTTTLPNGLAVPDASMHCVRSTEDVLELMRIGLMNRTVGATALNERSSRSHSVLSVHVRGMDMGTESVLRGSLHLVDLAGSERVDRSEVTGDRLKEAQHINKSLSALGDVISALAQKSSHIPYRNSKLTQVLQSSLGGQAKTLMFVQINPDEGSYLETVSTLKFAERVSGVELGAARSNKEGRDVRHLMQQVSNLKDVIVKKDEEIQKWQELKGNIGVIKRGISYGASSPRRQSMGGLVRGQRGGQGGPCILGRATSDASKYLNHNGKHSESGSRKDCRVKEEEKERDVEEDEGEVDDEDRLSDTSDTVPSMATQTDGAMDVSLFLESKKHLKSAKHKVGNMGTRVTKETTKGGGGTSSKPSRLSLTATSSKPFPRGIKKAVIGSSSSVKAHKRTL